LDIALTVATFVVPEAGAAIWAYRAYRIVRAARAAEGMAGVSLCGAAQRIDTHLRCCVNFRVNLNDW
jgi:hypothetical protein